MPIDPVTFVATTAAAVAANKHEKSEVERKTKALNDNLRIATQNHANLVNRELLDFYGEDEPLGTLYDRFHVGRSFDIVADKHDWLVRSLVGRDLYYHIDYIDQVRGWNKAWGDPQTEIAKYQRKRQALKNPSRYDEIMNRPLENYYLPRDPEVIQREQQAKEPPARKQQSSGIGVAFMIFFLSIGFLALVGLMSK